VAGRTLINIFQNIQADHNIYRVEISPRVLRLIHDLPNEETVFSAYQKVFMRDRPLAEFSIPISQNHSDVEDLLSDMDVMYEFML